MLDRSLAGGIAAGSVAALGAVAAGMAGYAPWVAVVFLLLGGVALFLARRESPTQVQRAYSDDAPAYWQEWLQAWYWETDAEHRLVLLKPVGRAPRDWLWARECVGLQAPLWGLWGVWDDEGARAVPEGDAGAGGAGADGSGNTGHGAAAAMAALIETYLKAHLPVPDIDLPAPMALPPPPLPQPPAGQFGEPLHADAQLIRLRGMPRFDSQGRYRGHHGVWQWLPDPAAALPSPPEGAGAVQPPAEAAQQHTAEGDAAGAAGASQAPQPSPAPAGMTEREQEMLRYALSHDLRAPVRVVDGFARILKEDYGRVLDRLGNDHLDRVLAAAARMNGMIDAILAQAQLGQASVDRCPVDLTALAREVADEQCQAARRPDGQAPAHVVVAEGLATEADPILLRRVLDNLIGNALKYTGKVAQPRVEIGLVEHTDPPVYFVRDNGAGFDMQHADKLFGLFQRLHSHKEFPGTGVGLAGVQNIIRRHGGRVWAEATPGEGACFYFTLESSPASARQAPVR